jgi:hypothetical protein
VSHDVGLATEAIYDEVRRCCLAAYGTRIRSIVATGSLARDEATFFRDGDRWVLAGDAEFLLIFADGAEVPTEAGEDELAQRVEAALTRQGFAGRVDLSAGSADYLRQLTPGIFAYELRECGRVISGDAAILSLIPPFASRDIPLEDAWRLLANRLVEQLDILSEEPSGHELSPKACYRMVKLYLDMATSFLVFVEAYAPTYRERAERLRVLAHAAGAGQYPLPLEAFAEIVDACTRWKLAPESMSTPRADAGRWVDALRDARRLWRWELGQLTTVTTVVSDDVLLKQWMARQSLLDRARGWVYVLRRSGWLRSVAAWPRWAWQAAQGSPRYWVYRASTTVLFGRVDVSDTARTADDQTVEEVSRYLPVIPESAHPVLSGSARLATAITWNYTKFLVRTRA